MIKTSKVDRVATCGISNDCTELSRHELSPSLSYTEQSRNTSDLLKLKLWSSLLVSLTQLMVHTLIKLSVPILSLGRII